MKRKLKSIVELKEILKNPSPNLKVPVYDLNEEGRDKTMPSSKKEKMTLSKLAKIVADGFSELRQDIKDINSRLDHVEARLDYCGLQIEQINKRLDYNNLKDLPNNN